MADKGIPLNTKLPLFKTEYFFASDIQMDDLIGALHDNDVRKKWDTNFDGATVVKTSGRVELTHIKLKSHVLDPQLRDVFEKKFRWANVSNKKEESNKEALETQDSSDSQIAANDQKFVYFSTVPSKENKDLCPE